MTTQTRYTTPARASTARLRILLLTLALWAALGWLLQLSLDTPVLDLQGDLDGVLGGRAFGGAYLALAAAYLFTAFNAERMLFMLWVGAVEQIGTVITIVVHWARSDIGFGGEEGLLPLFIALGLLVLILLNLGREREAGA